MACQLFGQQLSVDDFLSVAAYPSKKVDNYIVKKGFVPAGQSYQNDTIVYTWQQPFDYKDSTQAPVTRRFSKYQYGKDISISFQTSSASEYTAAVEKLKQDGFVCEASTPVNGQPLFFQKKNTTVKTYSLTEDSTFLYGLHFEQKQMPAARSIVYANSLLQFTSHEYLTAFFGDKNVRKDMYYFSEKEVSKCSVLFPNTSRQVVFIWNDELNLADLSHIIIGGASNTKSTVGFDKQIQENSWLLDNGLRFNMRLEELIRLNEADFSFFGRSSEHYLTIVPSKDNTIDFASTGVILDCFNCEGAALLDKKKISAKEAIAQGLRLHVSMIVLMPLTSVQK